MDDEIVDRVARAIYACVGSPLAGACPWWSNLGDEAQEFLRRQAEAAITAYEVCMMEKTDEEVAGGIK